jgi:hypothetical protein
VLISILAVTMLYNKYYFKCFLLMHLLLQLGGGGHKQGPTTLWFPKFGPFVYVHKIFQMTSLHVSTLD